MTKVITLFLTGVLVVLQYAFALAFDGEKQLVLITEDKQEVVIGKVRFKPNDKGASIDVKLESPDFKDHFLSMRPFRCIEHVKQTICHLQYPYKTHRQVSASDLTDLEYELLFLHKKKGEYGIDAWNGIYYKLTAQQDGSISGVLMEADMNALASPPDREFDRPIGDSDLTEGQPSQYRFPTLAIK